MSNGDEEVEEKRPTGGERLSKDGGLKRSQSDSSSTVAHWLASDSKKGEALGLRLELGYSGELVAEGPAPSAGGTGRRVGVLTSHQEEGVVMGVGGQVS
jgi:hypothetical protein